MSEWGPLNVDKRHNSKNDSEDERDETWTGGFIDRCTICDVEKRCHNHHVSYEPERTKVVCNDCHYKIHNEDGYYDRLNPLRDKQSSQSLPNEGRLYDIPQDVPGATENK